MPTDAADPPRTRAAAALVALLGLLALELVRSSGPLLDMAFTQGVVSAPGRGTTFQVYLPRVGEVTGAIKLDGMGAGNPLVVLDDSAIFVETDHIKDAPPSGGFRNAPPLSEYPGYCHFR